MWISEKYKKKKKRQEKKQCCLSNTTVFSKCILTKIQQIFIVFYCAYC